MADNEEIKIKAKVDPTPIQLLKKEMVNLKNEILKVQEAGETGLLDQDKLTKLQTQLGEAKDKMNDLNDAVKAFGSESKFEVAGNQLDQFKSRLSSLDFKGAKESAEAFRTTVSNINPAQLREGFQQFAGAVKIVGQEFVRVGQQLLKNPLILIPAIIVAIVVAMYQLKDSIKIVGQAFDLLSQGVSYIIGLLKDLTDWLGLTTFAADELSQKTIDANKKTAESSKDSTNKQVADLDRRIALYKAEGKEVEDLLIQKQRLLAADARTQIALQQSTITELKKQRENASPDEIKDINKQIVEARKTRDQAAEDLKNAKNGELVIVAEGNKKEQDENKKKNDKIAADNKAAGEKEKAEKKRLKDELLALDKQFVTELENLNANTEQKKLDLETKRAEEKIQKLKDAGLNTAKAEEDLRLLTGAKQDALDKKLGDDRLKLIADYEQKTRDLKGESALIQIDIDETNAIQELEKLNAKESDKQKVREYFAALRQKTNDEEVEKEQTKIQDDIVNSDATFNEKLTRLQTQEEQITTMVGISEEKRTELIKQNADAQKKIEDAKFAHQQKLAKQVAEIFNNLSTALGESTSAGKAAAVASTLINTYASAHAAYKGMVESIPGPIGIAAGAVAAAAAVAAGLANVQKIVSVKVPNEKGTGAGAGAAAAGGVNTPATPNVQLQGTGGSFNTATPTQAVTAAQQPLQVNVSISETEITDTQNRVKQIEERSTLGG